MAPAFGTHHATRALMQRIALLLTFLALLSAPAGADDDEPLLIELPDEVLASAVGANGFVVVGGLYSGGAFTWLPTSGVVPLGGRQAIAVSRDGRTIVGEALDSRGYQNATIWSGGTIRTLGSFHANAQPCDTDFSNALGTSADGKVVVGLAWDGCRIARAFRWEESTGVVDLGTLVEGQSSRADGISGNGKVIVGWQEDVTGFRKGSVWIDGRQQLVPAPFGLIGQAFAANRDGSIIVGTGCNPFNQRTPSGWRWTPAGVECLPVEKPRDLRDLAYSVQVRGVSDDGRIMAGAFTFGLDSESLLWIDGQVHFLKDYLRANGIPEAFEGWINTGFVTGVSPDGRTLVGYGAGPRTFKGFVVVLPELESR
jgi:probable HAF family extracellular repeat protein